MPQILLELMKERKALLIDHGTHDHPDESSQSIVNNSCTVHQLIYELVT